MCPTRYHPPASRSLLIAAGFSLLALLTLAVVWAGRNGPPPLWGLVEPYLVKTESPGAGLLRPVRGRRKLATLRALT